MPNKIYDLLNDVQTDVQAYESVSVSDLDKKRMKQAMKQRIGKRRSYKKMAGVACAAALVAVLAIPGAGSEIVYAAGEGVAWHISNFMGLDRNLQDYATVIGTSQTDQGYTIRLNEVVLDQGSLVVSTSLYKEGVTEADREPLQMVVPTGMVYVNGRPVLGGASGGAGIEDDLSVSSVIRYDLDGIDTSGELDIKLVFRSIGPHTDAPKGKWQFHFVADGSVLAADTVVIPLDQSFTLDNGVDVTLTQYTGNALGQRVYFTLQGGTANDRSDYMLRLQGVDDQGQEIIFETSRILGKEGTGYMICEILGAPVTEATQWLELTPCAAAMPKESGRMNGDYQQVGEPFHIDLVQQK